LCCDLLGWVIIKTIVKENERGYLFKNGKFIKILTPGKHSFVPSKIIQYLKGRSSRLVQDEFPELKKRYWR
jgi:regulator of protease activity HflC (stomatin/prohibitin superfamily)